MATNLRLRPDAEAALRAEAERSHRSQQDIIREAIDRYLTTPVSSGHSAVWPEGVVPPRTSFRDVAPSIDVSQNSLELLERQDRF